MTKGPLRKHCWGGGFSVYFGKIWMPPLRGIQRIWAPHHRVLAESGSPPLHIIFSNTHICVIWSYLSVFFNWYLAKSGWPSLWILAKSGHPPLINSEILRVPLSKASTPVMFSEWSLIEAGDGLLIRARIPWDGLVHNILYHLYKYISIFCK